MNADTIFFYSRTNDSEKRLDYRCRELVCSCTATYRARWLSFFLWSTRAWCGSTMFDQNYILHILGFRTRSQMAFGVQTQYKTENWDTIKQKLLSSTICWFLFVYARHVRTLAAKRKCQQNGIAERGRVWGRVL